MGGGHGEEKKAALGRGRADGTELWPRSGTETEMPRLVFGQWQQPDHNGLTSGHWQPREPTAMGRLAKFPADSRGAAPRRIRGIRCELAVRDGGYCHRPSWVKVNGRIGISLAPKTFVRLRWGLSSPVSHPPSGCSGGSRTHRHTGTTAGREHRTPCIDRRERCRR